MSQSPVPAKKKEEKEQVVNFQAAIVAVLDHKKVGRVSWPEDEYMFMNPEGYLMIHKDGKDHTFILREVDMQGVDFMVIK